MQGQRVTWRAGQFGPGTGRRVGPVTATHLSQTPAESYRRQYRAGILRNSHDTPPGRKYHPACTAPAGSARGAAGKIPDIYCRTSYCIPVAKAPGTGRECPGLSAPGAAALTRGGDPRNPPVPDLGHRLAKVTKLA